MARLVKNVSVDGTWYGPAHGNAGRVPADVAARIDNPSAWDDNPNDDEGTSDEARSVVLDELGHVPDDKQALLDFRDAHGLDEVNGRLGVDKLRQAITDALTD